MSERLQYALEEARKERFQVLAVLCTVLSGVFLNATSLFDSEVGQLTAAVGGVLSIVLALYALAFSVAIGDDGYTRKALRALGYDFDRPLNEWWEDITTGGESA